MQRLTKTSQHPESEGVCCWLPLLQTWEVLAGTGVPPPPHPRPCLLPALGCLFSLLAWLVSVLSWDGLL